MDTKSDRILSMKLECISCKKPCSQTYNGKCIKCEFKK